MKTRTAAAAAAALCAGVGLSPDRSEPCSNDAGEGSVAEGEACLVDHDTDTTNGGCNSNPPVYTVLTSGDFTAGVAEICGTASTYRVNAACETEVDCDPGETCAEGECTGGDEPSVNLRDTDWYLIPQSVLSDHDLDGNGVVQLTSEFVSGEIELMTFWIDVTDPYGACHIDILDELGCFNDAAQEAASYALAIADHPDGIVAFAAPGECSGGGVYEGYECSGGQNDYVLRITFSEPHPACTPDAGPCGAAHLEPGCHLPDCCRRVCEVYPFCCDIVWSAFCAEEACFELCGFPQPGAGATHGVCLYCPQDLDSDKAVGVTDFLILLSEWGPHGCPPWPMADFDYDCVVGVTDFLILLAHWGPCDFP